MPSLSVMKARLKKLKIAIKETEARLPAHSVKPPVMMDLLALEDEYEHLVQQVRECQSARCDRSEK